MRYKLAGDVEPPTDLHPYSRTLRRKAKRQATRYKLVENPDGAQLVYVERNGQLSKCLRKTEITEALDVLHDVHGHFAHTPTLQKAIGLFYWPSHSADILWHCRSCHECQMLGPLRPSANLMPVMQLQPLDMLGLDFMGPITPRSAKGDRYILIIVDYCTRFLWASALDRATSANVWRFSSSKIFDVFGYPRAVYTDNGSHFTGGVFPLRLKQKGVNEIHPPPASPSSVGLSEAYVKLVKKGLQTTLQKQSVSLNEWDKQSSRVVQAINSRQTGKWKYSPGELLLGYAPVYEPRTRTLEDAIRSTSQQQALDKEGMGAFAIERQFEARLARLDEIRDLTIDARADEQIGKLEGHRNPWIPPKVGDLVLLRRYRLDTQKSKKLECRWSGPYVLASLSYHNTTAVLQSPVTGAKIGKHHVDHLKLYVERKDSAQTIQDGREKEQEWAFMPEDTTKDSSSSHAETDNGRQKGILPTTTEDPFLHWITQSEVNHADETNPAYWLRKACNLRR